ncbi:MAG: response regulator transcription factor [Deltaproteobacteria bacterium]|nr:response regulator transcription factor [Deltaproteobacteria bacterium]
MSENEKKVRLLLIEDDPSISLGLRVNLQAEGYEVEIAADGRAGLAAARKGFDLILLDVMMPEINGFEVLQVLRSEGVMTPTIVLTALSSEEDKVTGLDLGAEDYVTKPFSLAELLARVRSVLRRAAPAPAERWAFGEVKLDPRDRSVTLAGEPVELTRTEFDLLATLLAADGAVVSRQGLIDEVWGAGHKVTPRTVDNFIAQLRAKLEADAANPEHLLTVRGVGYRLNRG